MHVHVYVHVYVYYFPWIYTCEKSNSCMGTWKIFSMCSMYERFCFTNLPYRQFAYSRV